MEEKKKGLYDTQEVMEKYILAAVEEKSMRSNRWMNFRIFSGQREERKRAVSSRNGNPRIPKRIWAAERFRK